MDPVFLGVRHHSPACARLVRQIIEQLRPAYVLVEGPADFNGRMAELLLGHELPIAVFSHLRAEGRAVTSWSPLCDYSPEWVALAAGRAVGAELRFIDLPAWHSAFGQRQNRYADAEARYESADARLCEKFGEESFDGLWDAVFEAAPPEELSERLSVYFDLLRGEAEADPGDQDRERYMAAWVRAAVRSAGEQPVLVVTGGFHTPALRALVAGSGAGEDGDDDWPTVPEPPAGAVAGSFLVPYTFRRLDAFTGYQSGMPSPGFYQHVWEQGLDAAADLLVREVATRLRGREQQVSTADLIAVRAMTGGLAAMRGHQKPTRSDVFDGLASALIIEALDQPLPWARRTPLSPGAHPVAVEIVAASRGERTGRLHPDTPAPPLAAEVDALLAKVGLDQGKSVTLKLAAAAQAVTSRALHRVRVLGIPGTVRVQGPRHGGDPVWIERWEQRPAAGRAAALIEAGAFGATLEQAAAAVLEDRLAAAENSAGSDLSGILFDAVQCGATEISGRIIAALDQRVRTSADTGGLGRVLVACLGLWRHDRVYGVARSPLLAAVVDAATRRVLWLIEGARDPEPDPARLGAVAGVRDAVRHAPGILSVSAGAVAAVVGRVAADPQAPVDLRGAAFGLGRILAEDGDDDGADRSGGIGTAVRDVAAPRILGDWLCGLFAVAREKLLARGDRTEPLLVILDRIVVGMDAHDFLVALPSLRQAFAYFPPRERAAVAVRLIELRGLRGDARGMLRVGSDPLVAAAAAALEDTVRRTIVFYGLSPIASPVPVPVPFPEPVPVPVSAPLAAEPATSAVPADMADPTSSTGPSGRAGLERWRLILGAAAAQYTGALSDADGARDAALDWLYGRDEDAALRAVRRGGNRPHLPGSREGGSGPSAVTAVDWLDDVHRLFPRETIERLEHDAVERYGIAEIVTDPAVLERVTPNPGLLRAVLRTKHLMNPRVLELARRIVDQVVRDLMQRIAPQVRRSFSGTRSRTASRLPLARDFDFRGTLRANLAHYQPIERRVLIERPRFHARTRKHLERWQLIMLVDQSGSMVGSVIHSAVTAACLWGLPGLKTHLIAFDTEVVDLTSDVTDPVELLMRVQSGGGTDIAKAVDFGAGLVENPRRSIVVLITDFFEGGDSRRLVRGIKSLVEQGTTVVGLAALDEDAFPAYDRGLAGEVAGLGAHVGAMTSGGAGRIRRGEAGPMTEPAAVVRQDLVALDAQILTAMSNRGLVKRAQKDIDTGVGPELDVHAGTVRGRFPDGAEATFPPAAGLDASLCTCGAAGICRHRICLVLAYQQAHSEVGPGETAAPDAPKWSPGDVDDETLAALVGTASLKAARRTFVRGYAARVYRSDAVPWVELPACIVRFPIPGEAAHALTDAATARRGEVIALAVWAFRAADATGSRDDLVRVEVGGDLARAADPITSGLVPALGEAKTETVAEAETDQTPARPASPVVARAFTEALDVALNLLIDGGAHADAVLSSTLFQRRHDLSSAGLHWPAAAFGEMIDQLEAYQSRSADYQHIRLARAIAELHARHRALGRAPLPAADILGTGEREAVPLRRTRLTALGARVRGERTSRTAEVYFAQPQAGITLVLKRKWTLDPAGNPDPAHPTGHELSTRRILGGTLHALAVSNLVSETATRSPSRVLTVSPSRIAPTAVLPVGSAWSELREPILVSDFQRLAEELARRPPSFLRPRIEAEAVRLVRVAGVAGIGYDVADQTLRAEILDEHGTRATLTAAYNPVCPGALDALAEALAAGPRYISGVLTAGDGRLAVEPIAVLTDHAVLVPDFAPGDGSGALDAAAIPTPAPIAAALADALNALAELAGTGLRLAGRGAMAGVTQSAAQLARIGLTDCAAHLRAVPEALRQNGFPAAAACWIDAYIHLSVAAEIH